MPELPEVETVVKGLSLVLPNLVIKSVEINKPKMWQGLDSNDLTGSKIISVRRVSKVIIINFDHGLTIMIHLKMTGQLIFVGNGQKVIGGHPDNQVMAAQPSKYTHITFGFEDGSHLYFNDMRQFGYAKLIKSEELKNQNQIKNIGVEPFDDGFTTEFFQAALAGKPKKIIKQLIMDQSIISGLGNIYANESLFLARIAPTKLAGLISNEEAVELHKHIKEILEKAIMLGGTSYKDYVNHEGKRGSMQDELMVYHRKGLPCNICGTIIERIAFGGRGTYYCPKCQK